MWYNLHTNLMTGVSNTQGTFRMKECEVQSLEHQGEVIEPDEDATFENIQIALDVLKSHEDLDDCYKDLSEDQQWQVASSDPHIFVIHRQDLTFLQRRGRIERYYEVRRKNRDSRPGHHFSTPMDDCFDTYQSGLFVACAMMTHPINEAIIRFVIDRNDRKELHQEKLCCAITILRNGKLLSSEAAKASIAIYGSYRNDIHHMTEKVTEIEDWHDFAKRNLRNLAKVESCVFG